MNLVKRYLSALQNTDFKGRAGRAELWTFQLVNAVVIGALAALHHFLSLREAATVPRSGPGHARPAAYAADAVTVVLVIFVAVVIIPWFALAMRRLHDTGRSGAYLLLIYVPFGTVALLVMFSQRGHFGTNQYGPPPGTGGSGAADFLQSQA